MIKERVRLMAEAEEALLEHSVLRDKRERAHQCHAVSVALARSGHFPGARVARGSHPEVPGQHSWLVVPSEECDEWTPLAYDRAAWVIDATLWSYSEHRPSVWVGRNDMAEHVPHGYASIFMTGMPVPGDGAPIEIPADVLTAEAVAFLRRLGPLDALGWGRLFAGGMLGWPSVEIVKAAAHMDSLRAFVPIDIRGMLTDDNPGGLYLATGRVTAGSEG